MTVLFPSLNDSNGLPQHSTNDALLAERDHLAQQRLVDLFAQDQNRASTFAVEGAGLFLDYSKNHVRSETLQHFEVLLDSAELDSKIDAMFSGEKINCTESRAVLHTALRAPQNTGASQKNIQDTLDRIASFVDQVHDGRHLGFTGKAIKHVINLGVGGSDLGPSMAAEALSADRHPNITVDFVSNIDPAHLRQALSRASAEETLFVICSKTFTTLETRSNANAARAWFLAQGGKESDLPKHFIAVTSNITEAEAFGIQKENIFPMWDWVGGRYSLWSAIGISIALATSVRTFKELLEGGHAMDRHFREAPLQKNMPKLLACLAVWYNNFFGAQSHCVVSYEQCLAQFPAYLQQLDMESNGKGCNNLGERLSARSGVILWGGTGTNTQHSFHQLLHQGTLLTPVDFIVGLRSRFANSNTAKAQHAQLFSNCVSQSRALMAGRSLAQVTAELADAGLSEPEINQLAPHKVIPGNRPSNLISYQQLDAKTLGALIALYEHKIFTQSVLWGINAFDQWGVELGKHMSNELFPFLSSTDEPNFDESTNALIKRFRGTEDL